MESRNPVTLSPVDSAVAGPPADRLRSATPRGRTEDESRVDLTALLNASEQRAEAAERRIDALERALTTRAALDQAKGVLMAMFGLDADAAFNALVWVSQHANTKVSTVAERFITRACTIDLTARPHERLTSLLAELTADANRSADPGEDEHRAAARAGRLRERPDRSSAAAKADSAWRDPEPYRATP